MQGTPAIPHRVCALAGPCSRGRTWSAHPQARDRPVDQLCPRGAPPVSSCLPCRKVPLPVSGLSRTPSTKILWSTLKGMQALRDNCRPPDGPWADLGSGSGALAIALARALPDDTQVTDAAEGPACSWSRAGCALLALRKVTRESCCCSQVYAVEKSADAETWLRHNVDRYSLQGKVQVRINTAELTCCEMCDGLHTSHHSLAGVPQC